MLKPSPKKAEVKPVAKPVDPAAAARKEIVQVLKGPVCERLKTLIPALADSPDVYAAVMGSPDLLHGCLQLFHARRAAFQDLLVDAQGQPVTVDDQPLRCGRSAAEIIGMIVRSGANAYAERRFAPSGPPPVGRGAVRERIEALRATVAARWETDLPLKRLPGKPPEKQSGAEAFYAAVKDRLEHDWQVPLLPFYAELPPRLIGELGAGLLRLRRPEDFAALAELGRRTIDGAHKILSEEQFREMMECQPLAAEGVVLLGKDAFGILAGILHPLMGPRFWDVCTDGTRLEALERRSQRDLEQLVGHLPLLSGGTIASLLEKLGSWQFPIFLDACRDGLGEQKFLEVFGVPGMPAVARRLIEKAAQFQPRRPILAAEEFTEKMPEILNVYLRDPQKFESGW